MNKSWHSSVRALCLSAGLALPLAVSASVFSNGGFDAGGACGAVDITTPGAAPSAWVGGGTLGNMNLFCQSASLGYINPKDGVNSIGFGGNWQTGARLSQTFDTVVGEWYSVEFFTSSQQGGSGIQSFRLDALNGADVLASLSSFVPSGANDNGLWASHTLAFLAAGSTSTIRFSDISVGDESGGVNWALDAVSVTGRPATGGTVPEPTSLALAALSLAALGAAQRRRR